ncbi:hypothetical protein PCASD_20328 [Puccinia coronata f. sp. avenae]|uniref:Uncharacterized protein n=1 Tax=Puccinia coronata f. sp. avenae TaxID=200324 RepID=A0A2N5U375_9BASI|nr:hypothetical protein PCASD_20328 [Puccinia coronata f. sp. avenae]
MSFLESSKPQACPPSLRGVHTPLGDRLVCASHQKDYTFLLPTNLYRQEETLQAAFYKGVIYKDQK